MPKGLPYNTKIVCIGGGSGPSLIANAFSDHLRDYTAIVAVTDSGDSTGTVRRNFDVAATGDLRATLSTLARHTDQNEIFTNLLEYRFQPKTPGHLSGMALGNLILTALVDITGNLDQAVSSLSQMLKVKGRVLPVSRCNTQLMAELSNGQYVRGEHCVRKVGKAPIKRIFLENSDAVATDEAVEAIRSADLVCLGPGNLFTSLLTCLLFTGVREALAECSGRRIFIANTTTEPGQTSGYSLTEHVAVLMEYVTPGSIDLVVVNNEVPPPHRISLHEAHGVCYIPTRPIDVENIETLGPHVIKGHLLEPESKVRHLHKLDTIRHCPKKLRELLDTVL